MTSTHSPKHTALFRAAMVALLLTAAGCAGSAGTAEAPGAGGRGGGSDRATLFTGNWVGYFDLTMVAGDMRLTLNHDGDVWTGEVFLDVQGESISAPVESFALTDEGCTFTAFVDVAEIVCRARIEEGSMAGIMEAFAQSELVAEGTFVLKKM